MKKGPIHNSIFKRPSIHKPIPKKQDIFKEFWFVNAGILPQSNYDKAVLFVGTYHFNSADFLFTLFLGIKYLIHYIELLTFDNTPLVVECIEKQLKYLQLLLGKQKKSKKFMNYGLIIKLKYVFDNLIRVEDHNYVCRQIYIDQLERFCALFAIRLDIWIKNSRLQAYLMRFGYDQFRSSAIYNSFLIPNVKKYVEPLNELNQKFIEKIEIKCRCKIMISEENTECYLSPEYVTLEVIFDLYHGNYLGFIEMFGYIVKRLNPTQYFAKSLRTILIEGSILYNILTNVPIKKLRYLEKSVIAGCPIAPFLSADSISKQFFSIVAMIRDQEKKTNDIENIEKSHSENSQDLSKNVDSKDLKIKSHKCGLSPREWHTLQEKTDNINYSHQLLKYFQIKYNKEMDKINMRHLLNHERVRFSSSDLNFDKLMTISLRSSKSFNQMNEEKYEENINKPIPEKLLVYETINCYEVNDMTDMEMGNVNANSSFNKEINFLNEQHFPSLDQYEVSIDRKILEIRENFHHFQNYNINESNTMIEEHVSSNKPEIINFNDLSPNEKFSVLLNESLNEYRNEHAWINHKMRLMLRCNTQQTIDDMKCPFTFQRKTIKDRLHNKQCNHYKFHKPNSYSRSYSNIPKLNSKITVRLTNHSWMSTEANQILNERIEDQSSSDDSEIIILDANDLTKELPDVANYLKRFDKRLMDTFIRRRLFLKHNWISFMEADLRFNSSREIEIENICSSEDIYNQSVEENSEKIEVIKEPLAKKIYSLLLLLTRGAITEKNFQEMLDGQGVNFSIIKKINKSRSALPTYIGNLEKVKNKCPIKNLSRCLCQLVYDLIQLAYNCSQEIMFILKTHVSILEKIVRAIKDDEIKSAFRLLDLTKSLSKLNIKSYIPTNGPNTAMFSLSEEVSLLHDIFFKQPCCSFRINKHLGLHIIYHSMQLDDRLNAVEPFLKLPGDRRVRKIEKMCNCLITLRAGKHPVIPINEYFVDIFYDFETGNHFGVIDLLKQMMISQHKLLTIQDHRTLIAYPTGELWAFRDIEWLKKCYNTYKEDITKNDDNLFEDNE